MKKAFSTFLSTALIAATVATSAIAAPLGSGASLSAASSQDVVQVRNNNNRNLAVGLAAGTVLGLGIGAAAANNNRGNCDAYGNCYATNYYVAPAPRPVYYHSRRRGLIWDEEQECYIRSWRRPYCVD